MLQINANNKGVLLPSVALTTTTDNITIPSPAEGLIIWNNGNSTLKEIGFYYWFESKWNKILANGGNTTKTEDGNNWNLTGTNVGNYGGASTTLALGTKTYDDLIFKAKCINSRKTWS